MMQNSLSKTRDEKMTVQYESGGATVKLSPAIVKSFLVNGDASRVTDQEVVMFLKLCEAQRLNPFLREAYLIKYGNSPATIVTGKEVFTKRARRNKDYAGFEAGVVVLTEKGLENRAGSIILDGEQLVGGWAKVYIEKYKVPVEAAVSIGEYIGTKKDGEVNGQWSKKPATMIRKVALTQALREAFPEDFQGMYDADEAGVDSADLTPIPVSAPEDLPSGDEPEPSPPPEYDPLEG